MKDPINWKLLAPHEREGETADALLLRLHYSEDIPDEVRAEARKAGQYFAAACGAINKPEARRRIKEAFDALRADGRRVSEHVADAEGFELAGGDGAAQEADLNDGPKTGYTEAEGAEAIDMVEEQLRNEKRERKRREKQAKARRDAGFEFDEADGRDVYAAYEAWAGDRIDRRTAETLTGPCPNCGGKNRFECGTKDGRRLIVCRQCKPGRRNPDAFKRIMEVLGLVSEPKRKYKDTAGGSKRKRRKGKKGKRKDAAGAMDRPELNIDGGPDMEGLREIFEAWEIKVRFNLRRDCVEWKEPGGAGWLRVRDRNWKGFIQHIRTRVTAGKGKKRKAVRFTQNGFDESITTLAGERECDPVIKWLETLPAWDGEARLADTLDKMFGAGKDPLAAWAGRYVFLGAIQRAMKPGCELQEMPVLVGPQGNGKSTFLHAILAAKLADYRKGKFHFHKDNLAKTVEQTLGAWIVEFAELRGLKLAELESLKAYLSDWTDFVRLSYRRNPEDYPRRHIMIGTSNEQDCLPNDPSGNRRFVVVPCPDRVEGAFDWLAENLIQLWAEALYLYRDGCRANLPYEFAELQAERNEGFRDVDELETEIARIFGERGGAYTLQEIAETCGAAKEGQPVSRRDQYRIGKAIRNAGGVNKTVWENGKALKRWVFKEAKSTKTAENAPF